MEQTFVAVDVETANPDYSSICQIGAVLVVNGTIAESMSTLVDPETYFDPWNMQIHGITPAMVRGKPRFPEVADSLRRFVASRVVASHTAFDRVAIDRAIERYSLCAPHWTWLDTARVSRRAWKQFEDSGYGLTNVAAYCGIEFRNHDALEDARAAAQILLRAMEEAGLDVVGWLTRVRQPIDQSRSQVSREGNPVGPLAGEVVVFTGALSLPRVEVAARAAALGCDVRNSVTSKTTMLVVGQQDLSKLGGYTKSTKQRKAEELISQGASITILGEYDFIRLGEIQIDVV